jgi:hypothetical protein
MERDSEHAGAADTSANDHGESLNDYYVAALEYIDSSLTTESTLEDLLRAARRRQEELRQRPPAEVREELSQLTEALLFAQRVLRGPQFPLPGIPDEGKIVPPRDEPTRGGDSAAPATLSLVFSADPHVDAESHAPPIGPEPPGRQSAADAEQAEPALQEPGAADSQARTADDTDREEPAQALEPSAPAARAEPEPRTLEAPRAPSPSLFTTAKNRDGPQCPSLREVMAQARISDLIVPRPSTEPGSSPQPLAPTLPETAAWPILCGLALLAWQVWLALFCGWTITRLFVWPGPVDGYQLGWLGATGLLTLALAVAAMLGSLVWRYRVRTRRLTLLVNISALAILLDLAWLVALACARLHDAAMKPNR